MQEVYRNFVLAQGFFELLLWNSTTKDKHSRPWCRAISLKFQLWKSTTKLWKTIFYVIVFLNYCGMPGEVVFEKANGEELPSAIIKPRMGLPGTGLDGGPPLAEFWMRDRRVSAPSSLEGFYKISAEKIASTDRLVLYRDITQIALMSPNEAQNLLEFVEGHLDKLQKIYGDEAFPKIHPNQKIVILATNILDDYNTKGQFIAGFFAPRDLYANDFTMALYTSPLLISRYDTKTVQLLRGYSNENAIFYLDLNPTFNGLGFNNNKAEALAYLKDIILHELSHLFTYYRRVIQEKLTIHDLWISEGLAENAPHLVANTTATFEERLVLLASAPIQAELFKAPSLLEFSDELGYVTSLLFFSYLRHRLGSESENQFQYLVTVNSPTITGLNNLLQVIQVGDFALLYRDYVISTYISQLGRDLVALYDESGNPVNLGSGNVGSRLYELSYKGIGLKPAGQSGFAFPPNSLPVAYDLPPGNCLKPLSYLTFRYTHNSPSDACAGFNPKYIGTSYNPSIHGTHALLRFIINTDSEIPSMTTATLWLFSANQNIPNYLFANCKIYHFTVLNPNSSGPCLPLGNLPIDERHHSSWVGGGLVGWQKGQGAMWGTDAGYFYRPAGVAFYKDGSTDYLYVTDYINMSITRYRAHDGSFEGRLGEMTGEDCTSDNATLDGYFMGPGRFLNSYCRRSFFEPRGLATDSLGNLYVADTANMRIVKYDKNGNFIAWLGLPKSINDKWQCEPSSTPAATCRATPGTGTAIPLSREDLFNLSNYENDVTMFYLPWGIVVDEVNDHFYVVNYGARRVVRRKLSTGEFLSYVGNGRPMTCNSWENSDGAQNPHAGHNVCYFRDPMGIGMDSQYLYVADSGNHRIVRLKKDNFDTTHFTWLGGNTPNWGSHPTSASSHVNSFYSPQDVTSDGTYLYVADRLNQRIVRRKISDGSASWLGGGNLSWQTTNQSGGIDPLRGGTQYLPTWYLEPQAVLAIRNIESNGAKNYLYITATYNGRLNRLNLDCAHDLINGNCTDGY